MNNDFFAAVLPPSGVYCAVQISQAGGSAIPHQTFHHSIDDLADRITRIDQDGADAYFAVATFEGDSRRAADAVELKSFFVDVDCGEGKPYRTQADAAVALREFVDATGMPPPWVINSGRGVHAYWPLDHAIPSVLWISMAKRFKRLCATKGFAADPVVIADAARIMRAPGTHNHKTSPALLASVMVAGKPIAVEVFETFLPASDVDLSAARGMGMDSFTASIAHSEFPATHFGRIVRKSVMGSGCAQIAHAVNNASTLEEPLWRAALSIAWRCEDASVAIHTLSRDHPGYDADKTIAKASATTGPMTCDWYRSSYPSICAGCTQTCSSPIQLGRIVQAAEAVDSVYVVEHQQLEADNALTQMMSVRVEIPEYPFPFFRGVDGGVYRRSKGKDGEPVEEEIYQYDLYLSARYYDMTDQGDGDGEMVQVNLHTPHDGIRRFVTPVHRLLVREQMREALLRNGVIAINKQLDNIMSYFAASLRNLQQSSSSERTRSQMGWTPDGQGFVVGEVEYSATRVRLAPAAGSARLIAPMFAPRGKLAEWSRMANFYARPGMHGHALALFFGFGAPLLRLVGGLDVRGCTINLLSSRSGTGKTTAQMMANAIWGHPGDLLLKINDTAMARVQWLGMLQSILVNIDEVTNVDDESLSNFIYEVPQGRGRHRMESQSNKLRANSTTWQTFAMLSSNASLYDKLARFKAAADGEMRRLMEFNIDRPTGIKKGESDAVFGAIHEHYGHAGPIFIQYVIRNQDRVIALWEQVQREIDQELGSNQSDRFYSKTLACAITGGMIANELSLINIPVEPARSFAIRTLRGVKEEVLSTVADNHTVAQEALMAFILENVNNVLVMGAPPRNGVPAAPIVAPRGPLRMRYETDSNELFIPVSELRTFMGARQIDVRLATRDLAAAGILLNDGRATPKRIGAGSIGAFTTLPVRCVTVSGDTVGVTQHLFAAPAEGGGDGAEDAPANPV